MLLARQKVRERSTESGAAPTENHHGAQSAQSARHRVASIATWMDRISNPVWRNDASLIIYFNDASLARSHRQRIMCCAKKNEESSIPGLIKRSHGKNKKGRAKAKSSRVRRVQQWSNKNKAVLWRLCRADFSAQRRRRLEEPSARPMNIFPPPSPEAYFLSFIVPSSTSSSEFVIEIPA